jgi:hypothetical protein
MALRGSSFSEDAAGRARSRLARVFGALLVPLMVGAILGAILMPEASRASHRHVAAGDRAPAAVGTWPTVARSVAGGVALRWSANVLATARLGVEPAGRCRRLDGRHAACPIGIAVLVRGAAGPRPWRCSATVVVLRGDGRLGGRRTGTHCVPFPPPAPAPDPAAVLGTALALDANGDVACLPASDRRVTCVMSYASPTGERCTGAASVPRGRPARSVALGAPVCGTRHPI